MGEWIFVRMVWLGLTLALIAYVVRYGPSIPWQDDWSLIPPLTGVKPVTVRWLWEQMNEHRLPLVKLVLVAAGKVTRGDARVGMLIVALLLAGLALAMIVVAERLRGALAGLGGLRRIRAVARGHGCGPARCRRAAGVDRNHGRAGAARAAQALTPVTA